MAHNSQKEIKLIKKVKRPIIRPCPCAIGHLSCNYIVISHILGCPYNCSYCFLHTFYGKDEIVIYDNNDDIIAQVSAYMLQAKKPLRIGTGQYSDSLALDQKTGLAKELIKLFAGQDQHLLELKTKSVSVDHLLALNHQGKTVFAWSVNPEKIVQRDELGAAGLTDRIKAAKKCAAAGYPVAFHFDPIIRYPGWEDDYKEVIALIFSELKPRQLAWISLGALRYNPELKGIIERRFPGSCISFDEHQLGNDGKMRYEKPFRVALFQQMREFIRRYSTEVYLYLCMESLDVWQRVKLVNSGSNPSAKYFSFTKKQAG